MKEEKKQVLNFGRFFQIVFNDLYIVETAKLTYDFYSQGYSMLVFLKEKTILVFSLGSSYLLNVLDERL